MKRMYYGSATVEVGSAGAGNWRIYNLAFITFASSEHEAKGWATETALKEHPQGRVTVVQMRQVPDDWVMDAARILKETLPCEK